MSDEQDKESRTEEPTERKLQKAHEQGDAPVSREAATFAGFAAILVFVLAFAGGATARLATALGELTASAGATRIAAVGDAQELLLHVVVQAALAAGPALGLIALAGFLASALQNPPRLIGSRVAPDLSRISPKKGFERIFGARGLSEFGKAALKLALALVAAAAVVKARAAGLANLPFARPDAAPRLLLDAASGLTLAFCLLSAAIFAADLFWSRHHWRRDQRMSRQDLRDEHKDSEGDPAVKARLRALAQQRSRKRMMAAVPRATMVIANPTHYAIALRYVREEGGAPLVLAKGKDLVALRIRAVAEAHGVPVVEDRALARSLHDAVETDRMIPPAFYRAVAEIIHMLGAQAARRAGAAQG